MRFALTDQPIDEAALSASLADPRAGALATFSGWVRNHNEGRQVEALEYEAYAALALSEGEKILIEAQEKFGLHGAACVHRTGNLKIGEMAVWVGATASHRDEAFRATRYIIDEIKARLPIWKREHYVDGTREWVNCQRCGEHAHHHQPDEAAYYQRQLRVPEIGPTGQARLKTAKVLVIGAGGLGCAALPALAGAGVGTIGICDFDVVEISNLHRQFLYTAANAGQPKAALAAARLAAANPFITVVPHPERFAATSAARLVSGYDIVLACTDNLAAKFLANEVCQSLGKPLIAASIYRFDGELLTVLPESAAGCIACLWPQAPSSTGIQSCAEAGVLGAVPALLGTMQALEAIKLVLGQPVASGDALLLVDGLTLQITRLARQRTADCPVCGTMAMAAE